MNVHRSITTFHTRVSPLRHHEAYAKVIIALGVDIVPFAGAGDELSVGGNTTWLLLSAAAGMPGLSDKWGTSDVVGEIVPFTGEGDRLRT